MDTSFSPEELAFRDEVRTFVAENYPEDIKAKMEAGVELTKEETLRWHQILAKKGWVAPGWPEEWGGTDWTPGQKFLFDQVCAEAGTPGILPFGISMVAPVIYTFGTDEQKQQHLPPIYNGDLWWCQGYSEPGSGSDLASLKTKAVRDGDEYIVNGSKTWTTLAQHADWIFCLVKTDTDVKAQEGISFLLIDMKTPGITVRPIITMDGGHEVNEVFLEDVRVPVANRIGEENKGWTYAKFLLTHERTGIAGVARSKKGLARLKEIAKAEYLDGRPLFDDQDFARKIAELEVDLTALEYTDLRVLAELRKGNHPGPESSILKIKGTEIQQRLTELTLEAVGTYGAPFFQGRDEGWNEFPVGPDYAVGAAPRYFNMRKTSIYGGSNEIQRNIIAKAVLGL